MHFDELRFTHSILRYPQLIESANALINKTLELGIFQSIPADFLIDIKTNGIKRIQQDYEKNLLAEISRMGMFMKAQISGMKESAAKDLSDVEAAASQMLNKEKKLCESFTGNDYLVDLEYLEIINNQACLTEKSKIQIKEMCTTRIETEFEANLWENFLLFKEQWNQLVGDLKSIGFPFESTMFSRQGAFFTETNDGTLELHPEMFVWLKRWTTKN